MSGVDTMLAQRLRQYLLEELNGTSERPGLCLIVARGVRSWDEYQKLVGRIAGIEFAIGAIDGVLRQLIDGDSNDYGVRTGLN